MRKHQSRNEGRYWPTLYKYVGKLTYNNGGAPKWLFQITRNGATTRNLYETEREAAIAADKFLINEGKKPVNILKPKT